MKIIKWILKIPIKIIKTMWFSVTLIVAGVSVVWNIPIAILATIVLVVQKILDWLDEKIGFLGHKKFKVEDDEPIEEVNSEDTSQEVGNTTTGEGILG